VRKAPLGGIILVRRTLKDAWKEAAQDLNLEVEAPSSICLPDGETIDVDVLVRKFGHRLGMVVVNSYEKIEPYADDLLKLGYGFSVMDHPREDERYDRSEFIDLLSEWSWSGDARNAPKWLRVET
jgi:hypothetical protein